MSTKPSRSPSSVFGRLFRRQGRPCKPQSKTFSSLDEFNTAYSAGEVDFTDTPFPAGLTTADVLDERAKQYKAPTPMNETLRQRTVDNLRLYDDAVVPHHISFASGDDECGCSGSKSSPASFNSSPSLSSSFSSPPQSAMTTSTVDTGLGPNASSELPTCFRPALQALVEEARVLFGTSVSIVNLSDRSKHVFFAESGFSAATEMDRGTTPCSHSVVKSSAGSLSDAFVVLDLALDWRFQGGNFGGSRFYASCPIVARAPLGDLSREFYPVGTLCVLDNSPRKSFSVEDRRSLAALAERAGQEIESWMKESRAARDLTLKLASAKWHSSNTVRRAILENVDESTSAPLPFDMSLDPILGLRHFSSTAFPPVSRFARSNLDAVSVKMATIAPAVASVFQLSCQLLAESLDLTFVYIVSCDLNGKSTDPAPLKLLASHNLPIPRPVFAVGSHVDTFSSRQSALLYTDADQHTEEEFVTGLLVRIATSQGGQTGFCLGGFSDRTSRVLGTQEWMFMRQHAHDLERFVALLE